MSGWTQQSLKFPYSTYGGDQHEGGRPPVTGGSTANAPIRNGPGYALRRLPPTNCSKWGHLRATL
jgi:hypothetical protein